MTPRVLRPASGRGLCSHVRDVRRTYQEAGHMGSIKYVTALSPLHPCLVEQDAGANGRARPAFCPTTSPLSAPSSRRLKGVRDERAAAPMPRGDSEPRLAKTFCGRSLFLSRLRKRAAHRGGRWRIIPPIGCWTEPKAGRKVLQYRNGPTNTARSDLTTAGR